MDEQKLANLFRDAAHDAPPASFDEADIRTASRRATLRRRNSIAAGTTLAVVLGFGGVLAANSWYGHDANTSSSAGAVQQRDDTAKSPMTLMEAQPPGEKNFPGDASSTQGDVAQPGSTGFSTGARAVQGCAAVDRELADALAGELSVSPDFAAPPSVSCSPASRSAMFPVDGLTVTAIVTPDEFVPPPGAEKAVTATGQDLYVFTQGDGELQGQVRRLADALAPRF
ncbi:hypothetical protein SAMN05216553_102202 [Lentzea fradiae]|uniref:Uncharacterized protein n=1 Tax=Lentzea fradiae TaxID=200378 RepID=A0A1G7MB98_9PSEU|nr:hypothetical protein [Lentzea fradiae]SDF59057.1 hypothetical protein SAMN05216553_102202 [Lentzea fradiae]